MEEERDAIEEGAEQDVDVGLHDVVGEMQTGLPTHVDMRSLSRPGSMGPPSAPLQAQMVGAGEY